MSLPRVHSNWGVEHPPERRRSHPHHSFVPWPLRPRVAQWRTLTSKCQPFASRLLVTAHSPRVLRRHAELRNRVPADARHIDISFDWRPKCIRVCPFSCCMETLPSALCWRIREPPFMRIRTILRSGYFASVLELRPVSRCKESSCRNWHSSPSRSISRIGSARPVVRINASVPVLGGRALKSAAMMCTFDSAPIRCVRIACTHRARVPEHQAAE